MDRVKFGGSSLSDGAGTEEVVSQTIVKNIANKTTSLFHRTKTIHFCSVSQHHEELQTQSHACAISPLINYKKKLTKLPIVRFATYVTFHQFKLLLGLMLEDQAFFAITIN